MTAYEKLADRSREIRLVTDAQSLLSWDQEVLLPKKGVEYRGRQMAWFSGWAHDAFTAPEVGEWIAEAESGADREIERANLREWRHRYDRATCLPRRLVEEFAEAQTIAKAAWAEARERSDFGHFAPHLRKLIDLSREKAECRGYEAELYDALLDEFERGSTTAGLTGILGNLREQLVPVVEEAVAREPFDRSRLAGHYPVEKQEAFNREVAESIGFDFEAGRIDTAVHPFCSGMAPFDARLTTRYDEGDFLSSLFGVLHETGHGLYEQGLPRERRGEPAGDSVSLGVHESQSRLWENHVGRSRPFWERWLPRAAEYFPQLGGVTVDEMVRAVNEAKLSHIRVESDEVTYDLHILLRFELEKAIFSGELEIDAIPSEWNRRFEEFFGIAVKDESEGCLQDIHWSLGIFGYFPTYSLGNINAAHLAEAALAEGDVRDGFERGDFAGLLGWMREKIHARGSVLLPGDLVGEAVGSPAEAGALVRHLRSRYLES